MSVEIEIRAAEIAIECGPPSNLSPTIFPYDGWKNQGELRGWCIHYWIAYGSEREALETAPSNDDEWAGWLAREIWLSI